MSEAKFSTSSLHVIVTLATCVVIKWEVREGIELGRKEN